MLEQPLPEMWPAPAGPRGPSLPPFCWRNLVPRPLDPASCDPCRQAELAEIERWYGSFLAAHGRMCGVLGRRPDLKGVATCLAAEGFRREVGRWIRRMWKPPRAVSDEAALMSRCRLLTAVAD